MLFNSYEFLFFYMPVTLAGFFLLGSWNRALAATWLAAASLFFYGWWNPAYVGLLMGSIVGNFLLGSAIARAHTAGLCGRSRALLILAVTLNLLLLAYYKYAGFFVYNVNALYDLEWTIGEIVLPLGISFFTFTQIAFLVDAHHGKAAEYNFIHYVLFVTYFPHLIAGPVLHHKEMMPQFALPDTYRVQSANLAVGGTIFVIGLFKKTILADNVAQFVAPGFDAPPGEPPSLFQAWGSALAYTLQLYFDFSGYSDMAIGLSRMIGVRLPLNFDSPYKAINIIEFWRRWHMTLSRFLRDYLYIALGGNRRGSARRHINLLLTMILGGLWHGAGWTFVIWGTLHGVYLIINHAWRAVRQGLGHDLARSTCLGRWAGRVVTLLAVVVGWVFFRAESPDIALGILRGMAGLNGISLPSAFADALAGVPPLLDRANVTFVPGGGRRFVEMVVWIGALLSIALLAPNTQEFMERFDPALDHHTSRLRHSTTALERIRWEPNRIWALTVGTAAACGLLSLNQVSEFLYFQF